MNLFASINNNLKEAEIKEVKRSRPSKKFLETEMKKDEEIVKEGVEELQEKIEIEIEEDEKVEEETSEEVVAEEPTIEAPVEEVIAEEIVVEEELDLDEQKLINIEEILTKILNKLDGKVEEVTEPVVEDEFHECEISSYKVARVSPKANAYMLEAATKEGLKYIVGKGFDKESKTLEEAEIFEDKSKASLQFKSLVKDNK